MGKVAVKQVSGQVYYLPDKMPNLPKSTLATFIIEDTHGNEGYCVIVENECDKNQQNGIFLDSRSFSNALFSCVRAGSDEFEFCQNRFRILSYDDEPIQKRIKEWKAKREKEQLVEKEKVITYLLNERGVKYLYHFTPYENLKGIAQYGIVPRARLSEDTHAVCLDDSRYDNRYDFSCFTLSFPNYRMLYPLHKNRRFVILEIDINILKEVEFDRMLFFSTNAANHAFQGYMSSVFQGIDAVKRMFTETGRAEDLPASYSTDPQAEVMIGATIPIESITALYFDPRDYKSGESVEFPGEFSGKAFWNQDIFMPRCDYQLWQFLGDR